jgi:hypothetical protein
MTLVMKELVHRFRREAIPFLISHIELSDPAGSAAFTGVNGYSCAASLQAMREAAFYPILERLQKTSPEQISDRAIRLYCLVILTHDKTRDDDSLVLIQRAQNRAQSKDNLNRLLAVMDQLRKDP